MTTLKVGRILLVEDTDIEAEAVERALTTVALEERLHRVDLAQDAWNYLIQEHGNAEESACVLLLDLNLPDQHGLDLLESIRANPGLCSLPVFILTTSHTPEDLERAHQHNVAGFFLKESSRNYDDLAQFLKLYLQLNVFPASSISRSMTETMDGEDTLSED